MLCRLALKFPGRQAGTLPPPTARLWEETTASGPRGSGGGGSWRVAVHTCLQLPAAELGRDARAVCSRRPSTPSCVPLVVCRVGCFECVERMATPSSGQTALTDCRWRVLASSNPKGGYLSDGLPRHCIYPMRCPWTPGASRATQHQPRTYITLSHHPRRPLPRLDRR